MSDSRPSMGARPVLTAVTLVCFGLLASLALVASQTPEDEVEVAEVPARFSVVVAPETPADLDEPGAPTAKAEEGVSEQWEAKADSTQVASLAAGNSVSLTPGTGEADKGKTGTKGLGSSDSLGGVIGAKGAQIGTRGVGRSAYGRGGGHGSGRGGIGFGGGGTADSFSGFIEPKGALGTSSPDLFSSEATQPDPRSAARTPPTDVAQNDSTKLSHRALTPTHVDAKSTFAADVDTGSYTYARRLIRSGQLPKPTSVRVEEFINFFRYDYAQPEAGQILGVTSELVEHPDTPGRHLLTIGVQAKTVAQADRKPVRLTFLVDTSGSMRGRDRLGLAQRAMKHALLGLGDEDTVAIVTYAGATQVALPPTPATRRSVIRTAIDSLVPRGGTAMDSGMALAYQQAEDSYAEGAENRVIVLSDGDANIGRTGAEDMLKTIRKHAEGGITLTTMGFGTGNYKDARMERLADAGDGAYVYIDGWSEAERVFGTQLGATLETVGRDVKLQLELDPARVKSWRQVGYINRQIADKDFRKDSVDAGEVGSGHQVTALYELVLHDGATSVGDLHLRIKPPGPDRPAKEWSMTLTRTQSSRPSADTRTAVAAMHLANGLHDRDPASLQRARDEAEALQAAGRKGASELAELSRLALRLLTTTNEPMATR